MCAHLLFWNVYSICYGHKIFSCRLAFSLQCVFAILQLPTPGAQTKQRTIAVEKLATKLHKTDYKESKSVKHAEPCIFMHCFIFLRQLVFFSIQTVYADERTTWQTNKKIVMSWCEVYCTLNIRMHKNYSERARECRSRHVRVRHLSC